MSLDDNEFHGCLTGDCPHDKQSDCDAALKIHWKGAYEDLRRLCTEKLGPAGVKRVSEMMDERDAALKALEKNRCNSGHETLPLRLWECPACVDLIRQERDDHKMRADDNFASCERVKAKYSDEVNENERLRAALKHYDIEPCKTCEVDLGKRAREALA